MRVRGKEEEEIDEEKRDIVGWERVKRGEIESKIEGEYGKIFRVKEGKQGKRNKKNM